MNSIEFLTYSSCRTLLIILICLGVHVAKAQDEIKLDTAFLNQNTETYFQSISKLNPGKAAMFSAILPGLGQIYNGQAWKVPIIYGGFIALGHYIHNNHQLYHAFRNSYIAETDGRDDTINLFEQNFPNRFTTASLQNQADNFRRDRDFLVIMAAGFYLINVAEAYIAAHLKEFDINDSLSMQLTPSIQSSPLISHTAGMSLRLSFR